MGTPDVFAFLDPVVCFKENGHNMVRKEKIMSMLCVYIYNMMLYTIYVYILYVIIYTYVCKFGVVSFGGVHCLKKSVF